MSVFWPAAMAGQPSRLRGGRFAERGAKPALHRRQKQFERIGGIHTDIVQISPMTPLARLGFKPGPARDNPRCHATILVAVMKLHAEVQRVATGAQPPCPPPVLRDRTIRRSPAHTIPPRAAGQSIRRRPSNPAVDRGSDCGCECDPAPLTALMPLGAAAVRVRRMIAQRHDTARPQQLYLPTEEGGGVRRVMQDKPRHRTIEGTGQRPVEERLLLEGRPRAEAAQRCRARAIISAERSTPKT